MNQKGHTLYKSNGDGSFTDINQKVGIKGKGIPSTWADIGDYNNDGLIDIIVFTSSGIYLYRQNANITFSEVSKESKINTFPINRERGGFIDCDNDGYIDIVMAADSSFIIHPVLLLNNRDGTFSDVSEEAGFNKIKRLSGFQIHPLVIDFDNNGTPDLFSPYWRWESSLLFRNTGNNNHYIKISVTGRNGYTSIPYGTLIKVVSGDLIQTKMINSHLYETGRPIIFGLGDRVKIDLIEIKYPDGIIDRLSNIDIVDRTIEITQSLAVNLDSDYMYGSIGMIKAGKNSKTDDAKAYPILPRLLQNFPNPANPETWIPYELSTGSYVVIKIYNITGQLVRILELGYKPAGFYTNKNDAAYWNGKDDLGINVPSGIYFYEIDTGKFCITKKLVLLK